MRITHLTIAAALALLGAAAASPCSAQSAATKPAQSTPASIDVQIITQALKQQFDKPAEPLKVFPVSVEGEHAVAAWFQADRGGRALLRKARGQWSIEVCAGDGLKQAAALEQAGLSGAAAKALAAKVQRAEAGLSAQQLRQLASFEGVVQVKPGLRHPQRH